MLAVTDAAGVFTFPEVPPGSWGIRAERGGFAQSTQRTRFQTIQVTSGQETTGTVLKLAPQGVITGRIVDEDGDPMLRLVIQPLRETWQRGRRVLSPASMAQTNDLGEYRIHGLVPGRYYLAAVTNRPVTSARSARAGSNSGYATLYYPGVTDVSQAQVIELAPGQEIRADLQFQPVTTFRVRGHVAGEPGSRRGIAVVAIDDSVNSPGLMGRGYTTVREDGSFEVAGLVPGSYTLVATRLNGSGDRARVPLQIGNSHVENVVLQLQPPVELAASVRIEGEQPADTSTVRLSFQQERSTPLDAGAGAARKADGKPSVYLVPTGRVRADVQNLPEGTYVKSIRAGSADVTNSFFDVSAGAGPVEVVLARGAGRASGTVQTADGKIPESALVVMAPDGPSRNQYWNLKTATTDSSGNFSVANLAPGAYTVYTFPESGNGAWQNPDYLKQHDSDATPVKIGENGSETLALKLAN